MSDISGMGEPIPPEMKLFYQDKFDRSVELFSKSLEGYQHAEFSQKKEQYKKVMNQALDIMNEAAKAGLSEAAKKESAKLQTQFDDILSHTNAQQPLSDTDFNQLQSQINKLKHSA